MRGASGKARRGNDHGSREQSTHRPLA
jgi:hypothetical protein